MKNVLLLFVSCIILSGCYDYWQLYEVKTTNTKLENGSFIFENDTVKLTYCFWAEKGVMSFSVYNKLPNPIYIDWKNSAFIVNNDKLNYWQDEQQTNSLGLYNSYFYKKENPMLKPIIGNAGISASSSKTIKTERITFIPPKSNYYRYQFCLLLDPIELNQFKYNDSVLTNSYGDKLKSFEKDFNYETTPLKFRNYIALSFSENSQQFSFLDNEFYVSSIKEADFYSVHPELFKNNISFPYNIIYSSTDRHIKKIGVDGY